MFWFALALTAFALIAALLMLTLDKPRKPTFLPWLDLISYTLTAATVVTLVLTTQGQIDRAFVEITGEDLDLGAARTDLLLFLDTQCHQEPECGQAAQAISSIANPRGVSKLPSRVDADVSRLPALAAAVGSYNEAFDQSMSRHSIMLLNLGFWAAAAVICGVITGLWRRVLVLRDAVLAAKPKGSA